MNLERVATLLANGLKPSNVASIIGCSPGRIAQICKEESFQLILRAKSAEAEKSNDEEELLGSKYHAAEHILLNQIIEMAPVSELRDVTAALRVVAERQDKAKTRLNPVQSGTIINQVISITVPKHTLPEIHLTEALEVTSVNTLNLAPLTSEGVTNLFKGMRQEKLVREENENEQRRISSTSEEAIRAITGEDSEVAAYINKDINKNEYLPKEEVNFLDSREDFLSYEER